MAAESPLPVGDAVTPPPDSAPAIVWACYLGGTTPMRLAIAQGIPRALAADRLQRAADLGLVVRVEHGRYVVPGARVRVRGRERRTVAARRAAADRARNAIAVPVYPPIRRSIA